MDNIPPEPPVKTPRRKKGAKIVDFTTRKGGGASPKSLKKVAEKPVARSADTAMALTTRLENCRIIFNASPKDGPAEKRALALMAELAFALPDSEPSKADYLRILLEFHEDAAVTAQAFNGLRALAPAIRDPDERLRAGRSLMRSPHCDEATKEEIANTLMDMLEDS